MCWKSGNRHGYRFVIGDMYRSWVGRNDGTRKMKIYVLVEWSLKYFASFSSRLRQIASLFQAPYRGFTSFDGTQDDCITFRETQEYVTAITPKNHARPLEQDGLIAWPHPT